MSLLVHGIALAALILDLLFASPVVGQFAGRWASVGFEFALVLGYVLFVLQWGVPWGRQRDDGG